MEFWKMHGAGNDFIILDNRPLGLNDRQLQRLAARLCARRVSIGADGLIAVEEPLRFGDFRMRFWNADGTAGEMCGNGARCICRYGYDQGLAGPVQHIETTAGAITGWRISENQYRIRLQEPSVLEYRQSRLGPVLYLELGTPGLPHCLYPVSADALDDTRQLLPLARTLRHDPAFPKGTNVNFYCLTGEQSVRIRTYERGVEDFTLACGTGAGALTAALTRSGQLSGPVAVTSPGGTLIVQDGGGLFLTGPADIVYRGITTDFTPEL